MEHSTDGCLKLWELNLFYEKSSNGITGFVLNSWTISITFMNRDMLSEDPLGRFQIAG